MVHFRILFWCNALVGKLIIMFIFLFVDCPDLLLETKRHVGEDDLRAKVRLLNTRSLCDLETRRPEVTASQAK